MQDLKNLLLVYFIFLLLFLFSTFIYRKKIDTIILQREIYLLELKNKELKRKNQALKEEIARRKYKNKESYLYFWKNYGALPDYENPKIIKIIIDED